MPWIKYDYSCRQLNTGKCVCDIPAIEIEISTTGQVYKFLGLIDSGCGITNVDAEIAGHLGIDLTACEETTVGGISGSAIGYISSIKMKLKDFDETFDAPVIFVKKLPVPILLGQENFFEKFDVKFEKRNNRFELKIN